MNQTSLPKRGGSKAVIVCGIQILLVTVGIGGSVYRYQEIQSERKSPQFREVPVGIAPQYDRPEIISDEQLAVVLEKLKPRLSGMNPRINHVDHALRFWGIEATFADPECLSGQEMRDLLLDHRRFASAWGPKTQPFLVPDTTGVKVRTFEGLAAASHVDHTLAGLAEVGTPLDFPVITPMGETTVKAVLESSLENFSLNQTEYEWSALAYALYLSPTKEWMSSEGQMISFDLLADRLMRQRLVQGVCRGNHRLHTLVVLLRVDDEHKILSDAAREQIIEHLQDVTQRFVASQSEEGYWDKSWPGVEWDGPQSDAPSPYSALMDRILVTGHVMEWWSLAPPEILPPDDVLIKAGQWLSTTIADLDDGQIKRMYTFLSHAGHALCLWRGQSPSEAWRKLR